MAVVSHHHWGRNSVADGKGAPLGSQEVTEFADEIASGGTFEGERGEASVIIKPQRALKATAMI
jgi:hypothetical protein